MLVSKKVYYQMISCPNIPPESGGILGTSNGIIINQFVFDRGLVVNNSCIYSPNTIYLNQVIKEWERQDIKFSGIFHTHAIQWPTLSNGDKYYIAKVLNALYPGIQKLYFPLVFPGKNIKAYLAIKEKGNIVIDEDYIKII